jgi:hypothetical protein
MNLRSGITVYFLTAVVLFYSSLSAIYFFPLKKTIRKNLEQAFSDEKKLQSVYFSLTEFQNLRMIKSNEFEYNGELYDIKQKTVVEGIVYLSVYHDIREKSLLGNFTRRVEQSGSDSGKSLPSLIRIFDLFDDYIFFCQPVFAASVTEQKYFCFIHNYSGFCPSVNSPPPNC